MIIQAKPAVRPADIQDRPDLTNLLHFETHIHRHLDWRPPIQWLGNDPFLVLEQNGRIKALLACPPDPPETAWIRAFTASKRSNLKDSWHMLWEEAREELQHSSATYAAAIPLHGWFRELLEASNFELAHQIVSFTWENTALRGPMPEPVKIRRMHEDDLETVQKIDQLAFGPLWQNTLETLRLAFFQCLAATVAEDENGLVGYQISTTSPLGAHLARLAVAPHAQEQGVGYALIHNLQNYFIGPNRHQISVNTQDNNQISMALYQKAGFMPTGEEYPVYLDQLK